MKKSILLIVLILTLVGFKAQGQIRDEIRSFVDSTEIFMNNGRRLLLHSIMEDDILKSRQIYFYLRDESQKKNCSALSYQEELLVLAIISDWSGFFNHVSSYNDFTAKRMCYSFTDQIQGRLLGKVASDIEKIRLDADNSSLSLEQLSVLNLIFMAIQGDSETDEYETAYKHFKRHYATSRYISFVNHSIPSPRVKANLSFSFGTTYMKPLAGLGENLNPGLLINMVYDFSVKKFYGAFTLDALELSFKKPQTFVDKNNGQLVDFAEGESFSVFRGGFSMGYNLVNSKHLNLSPFISIGGYTIESNLYYDMPRMKEIQLVNSFFWGPGVHLDLILFSFNMNQHQLYNLYGPAYQNMALKNARSYIGLKIDAGYDIISKAKYTDYKGNAAYLRVGLVLGMGNY